MMDAGGCGCQNMYSLCGSPAAILFVWFSSYIFLMLHHTVVGVVQNERTDLGRHAPAMDEQGGPSALRSIFERVQLIPDAPPSIE